MNQLLLSKQFQNGHLGTPWASQDGAENLPRTSLGAPGASPGRLQSTQSTSSKPSTRPRELPGDPKVVFLELKKLQLDAPKKVIRRRKHGRGDVDNQHMVSGGLLYRLDRRRGPVLAVVYVLRTTVRYSSRLQ